MNFYTKILSILLVILISKTATSQFVPELIYYQFDNTGTTVPNLASSPVGTNPAPITGTGLTMGSTGMFGTALVGTGVVSSSGVINTGWPTSITGSFTIAFWTSNITPSATLWYIFGDAGASTFRCFTNGVAGANNWMVRGGGLPDLAINGAATAAPNMIHVVYNSTTGAYSAYINGALVNTVSATPGIIISGTGFQVGGYGTNSNLSGNLDEFRLYNRALDISEIQATYNHTLPLMMSAYNPGMTQLADLTPFTQAPLSQSVKLFKTTVRNFGTDTITGTTVNLNVLNTTFSATQNVGTLVPTQDSSFTFLTPFFPTSSGIYTAQAIASCNEVDTIPSNDTIYYNFTVSDSVMAIDDGVVTNGIGSNTSPVKFGHRLSVINPDTVTSVSFYLDQPVQGSKIRILLFTFNPSTNKPDQLIDSSRVIQVPANGGGWYTAKIGCGQTIIQPGEYFLAAEQINPINMSFGYTSHYPSVNYIINYVDLLNGAGWLPSNDPALNQLLNSITFMLRLNFANQRNNNVLGSDTTKFCFGSKFALAKGSNFETYFWSNGSILDSLVTNTEGNYAVTVTDDFGCVYTGSTYLSQLAEINTFPSSTAAVPCGAATGSAQIVATGDYFPFTYNWSTGGSGLSQNNLIGGNYSVTVTDAFGCKKTQHINVAGNFPVVQVSSQTPTCNGGNNGSATANVIFGVGPYSYNWSSGGTSQTATGLTAGTATVTVTDNGCAVVDTFVVSEPAQILVDKSNSINPTLCGANNGRAVLNVSGGVQPYQFLWDNGKNTNAIISLKAGTYFVTITDSLGCIFTDSVIISEPNAPSLSTNGSTVICGDDSTGTASVNVTGGTPPYNYLWSTNSTVSSISNLPPGNYTVQVTDAANCIQFSTALVDGPDPIIADYAPVYNPSNICQTSIQLNSITGGTPPYTYLWNDPNAQTSSSATGLCNGTYTVLVTDANNCEKAFTVIAYNPKTSLNDVDESTKIEIYPNPSNGVVNISFKSAINQQANLKVLNALGQLVFEKNIANPKGTLTYNLENLPQGLYVVKIEADNQVLFSKPLQVSK